VKDTYKIALLGNMNNNNSVLARYLMDYGYRPELLLFEHELDHFLPTQDTYDHDASGYTKTLAWGSYKSLFLKPTHTIRSTIAAYDFLIGSRLAPAYFAKVNLSLDIFIPTGGDLCSLPFFNGLAPKRLLQYLLVSRLQRNGIASANALLWDLTNPVVENALKKIRLPADRILSGIPLLYLPDFSRPKLLANAAHSSYAEKFNVIRSQSDLMIFHHIRHVWLDQSIARAGQLHAKSNDILMRAFALLVKDHPEIQSTLVMFEYGPDVASSKLLCDQLGISNRVAWMPLMGRKELMYGLSLSDVMVGELKNSWLSYGAIMEAMAVQVPVIHKRIDSLYNIPDAQLYSMYNADDVSTVYQALLSVANHPAQAKIFGQSGFEYFKKNIIEYPISEIVKRIEEKRTIRSG
jgi:glycosyltransferase involved in cell wall biosynthesis